MRDLFGETPDAGDDRGEIALALVLYDDRPKAWLLGQTDQRADAQWIPKSQVKRGEGRDENVWTVPVWLARDRDWV